MGAYHREALAAARRNAGSRLPIESFTIMSAISGFQKQSAPRRARRVVAVCCVAAVAAPFLTGCSQADMQRWNNLFKKRPQSVARGTKIGQKENWTIECNEFLGPNHIETADTVATALKRVQGINPDLVRVEHRDDRSKVYYGTYELEYVQAKVEGFSSAEGDVVIQLSDEIKADMEFIRKLAMGNKHPFMQARAIQEPSPDVGPPELDLRSASGLYTLHVGVTYATPTLHDYKYAAIEWVKDLRSRGYQAYYYHDPEKPQTSICVGTFGPEALEDTGGGRSGYSGVVRALREKEELKYNLENGHIVYRIATDEKGKKVKIPNWSFLVKIPQKGQAPRGLQRW
ncbi:MAG: hypothetical protein DCC65_13970 [Planctomycetota bacterium]|nr:MAG: hypothetical protein DCC65_13970 [Planctomycetota bacterium]